MTSRLKERRFIRHPARLPIHFEIQGRGAPGGECLRDVSEGGLCFQAPFALESGLPIRVLIPLFGEQFEVVGHVAWCRVAGGGHEVGVRFESAQDRFCVRMIEQLCYIEDYRQQVEREERRQLSSEQAAREWIERFAGRFPELY